MRDYLHLGGNTRIPGQAADSRGPRRPSHDDIFQAATLLIGVYGRRAADYARQRRDRLDGGGDGAGAATWELILSRIEALLHCAPLQSVN